MPSDASGPSGAGDPDRIDPDALDAAVARYRRAERAVSWTLALLVAAAFLGAVAALSFWPGIAVGLALAAALRLPAYRRRGFTRLRTSAAPETVVREFSSARPPVLAFQWGAADEVRASGADGVGPDGETGLDPEPAESSSAVTATYAFPYLLGLRTAELDFEVSVRDAERVAGAERESEDTATDREPRATVEIEGTANGRQWASYAVTIREAPDGGSVVDVELRPTRRFGLRRLPQGWVAGRHYDAVLAAQGYEVTERTVSLSR